MSRPAQRQSADIESSTSSGAVSSGNRRNPRTHKAILKATLELLQGTQYSSLTIESIAARAGVGKATVYRWWPSKGALVAEAVSSKLTVEDPPDTGNLRDDLIAAAEVSIRNYARPPGGILVVALAADLASDVDLHKSFIDQFVLPRRATVRRLLTKAADEGLISEGNDIELLMDMWAGAVIYRALMKHTGATTDALAEQLVDTFFHHTGPPAVSGKGT